MDMLHIAKASQRPAPSAGGSGEGDESLGPPLPPPPGAQEAASLTGAVFDCVIPSLLMAVGGPPEDASEIAGECGMDNAASRWSWARIAKPPIGQTKGKLLSVLPPRRFACYGTGPRAWSWDCGCMSA